MVQACRAWAADQLLFRRFMALSIVDEDVARAANILEQERQRGIDQLVKRLAYEHALQLDHVPSSAVILGGGVIGCEFASAWTSFGAKVTIVEALPHLVPLEDEASSKQLERAFRRRG